MKIFERNLQGIGKSLLVSLPKEWTKLLKLEKGSKIKIGLSENGSLNISPEFTRKERVRKASFVFDDNFRRNFIRNYLSGNETIKIEFKNKVNELDLRQIYSFFGNFMNVQIVSENDQEVLVKVFKIENLSIEECLRRMHYISLDMLEERFGKNRKSRMEELEKSLTKFYFILVMQIRRFLDEGKFTDENQIPLIRALDFRMVGEKIERIADILKDKKNMRVPKEMLGKLIKTYESAFQAFFKEDYEKSLEANRELVALSEKIKDDDMGHILQYIKEISSLTR